MKGYKAFNQDMTCRGYQYEVGKTYHMDGAIKLCERGFHFCRQPSKCFEYYDMDSRLCEVEASGNVLGDESDKCVTNNIRIVREIVGAERNRIICGYGNGYGYGYGYGYGNGYGYGYGYGSGTAINRVLIYKED